MTRAQQMLVISAAQDLDEPADSSDSAEKADAAAPAKGNDGLFELLRQAIGELDPAASGVLPTMPEQWSAQAQQWSAQIQTVDAVADQHSDTTSLNTYNDIEASEGVRAAWSNLTFLPHEAVSDHALRLGTALHQTLERLTQRWGLGEPIKMQAADLSAQFAIGLSEAQQVFDGCERILNHPEWRQWFDPTQYDEAYNEMSVMTADGQTKRIDRWVRKGTDISVLDYKSGWDDAVLVAYERQMREYVAILHSLYPERAVRGYLLRVDGVMRTVNPD